jgi:hypothetical protein
VERGINSSPAKTISLGHLHVQANSELIITYSNYHSKIKDTQFVPLELDILQILSLSQFSSFEGFEHLRCLKLNHIEL